MKDELPFRHKVLIVVCWPLLVLTWGRKFWYHQPGSKKVQQQRIVYFFLGFVLWAVIIVGGGWLYYGVFAMS